VNSSSPHPEDFSKCGISCNARADWATRESGMTALRSGAIEIRSKRRAETGSLFLRWSARSAGRRKAELDQCGLTNPKIARPVLSLYIFYKGEFTRAGRCIALCTRRQTAMLTLTGHSVKLGSIMAYATFTWRPKARVPSGRSITRSKELDAYSCLAIQLRRP